ncbi:MAG: lipoyl synthase [Omnitrophica WOR_2 bacterium RIFCSPHIGHO2_02_FULL_67_20]|nr:MAG: lipoyl synthase [Omnitrophica WOR_2 bacterium RIFCSPHIGHO2_02_FULL_67_20]
MQRYPRWMKQSFSPHGVAREVRGLVEDLRLATVCESAVCPNLQECWSRRSLTFMILGERCTRSCGFCAVDHGRPQPPEADEPWRVAEAVRRLGLRHAVITSVARDDLRDEGAGHFADVIRTVRSHNPGITIETLVPDFHGREELIRQVLETGRPEVFAHNVETVERLSNLLRPQADYRRSLGALAFAAALGTGSLIKSSLMVGLGETPEEVRRTLADAREAGVTHLTIGQYLRPDERHLPVMEYVSPERFQWYERLADEAGFAWVKAGPFVRSSYHAVDALNSQAITSPW